MILSGLTPSGPRVINENVDLATVRRHPFDKRADGFRIAEVGGYCDRMVTKPLQMSDRAVQFGLLARHQHGGRPEFAEGLGDLKA